MNLMKWKKRQAKNPDKYLSHSGDVHWGYFDGIRSVLDCPCNKLRLYEDLIWDDRYKIAEFIKNKSADNLKQA